MSYTATVQMNVIVDGTLFNTTATETNEQVLKNSAAAAQLNTPVVGVLSTRTDANTGVVTVSGGHSIGDGSKVDVYWTGGSRYGMTTGSADATTFAIDLGGGDDLPIATTAVTVCVHKVLDMAFDGDEMDALAQQFNQDGRATFYDSGDAALASMYMTANNAYVWYSSSGATRPITGNPVAYVSVTNKTTAGNYAVAVLLNSI